MELMEKRCFMTVLDTVILDLTLCLMHYSTRMTAVAEVLAGNSTPEEDITGYETINDSKTAGFISNPAFVGAITQTSAGYEDIKDHQQMYIDGEWKNEGNYGV